eukprot:scaffold4173_cov117-Isochrysis_galbana.AAC.12
MNAAAAARPRTLRPAAMNLKKQRWTGLGQTHPSADGSRCIGQTQGYLAPTAGEQSQGPCMRCPCRAPPPAGSRPRRWRGARCRVVLPGSRR